ncbi:MAG TPA: electron transport complex subunit E [Clostridiales bacterium]|nr:electron transport complex subunit E [Clostridiales bacterium]
MKNAYLERLKNGIITENPTFVLMLGMCPTMAVTRSAYNGLGMGLTSAAVLIMSNLIISALRKVIPDKVRIPSYIVVVATLVTIIQFLLKAYLPYLDEQLGIYIPLIVVNCIILGRAEAYAAKNPIGLSTFDGIGMGLGFAIGLTAIGAVRELLGNGTIFDFKIMPSFYEPIKIFVLAPGAFFVLALLTVFQKKLGNKRVIKGKNSATTGGCACCENADVCAVNKSDNKS